MSASILGWADFFEAQLGASAALTGLLFVGIALNMSKILSFPTLPLRALQSLSVLVAILAVSTLLLVPGQPLWAAGLEVLAVGLTVWGMNSLLSARILRRVDPGYRRRAYSKVALDQLATALYVAAGIVVLVLGAEGIYLLVPAFLASFVEAVVNAWVLLVEINR